MIDRRVEATDVTVIVPTYREGDSIEACLAAIDAQTYRNIVEVLVVDGGSDDDTRAKAGRHPSVTVLDNPARIQSAALNVGIAAARGAVIVRVDGHTCIAEDYVEHCVAALARTGAAIVGGAMSPTADGRIARGIAAAMGSRFGAGPARFHTGGAAGWVDTVYLGAYPTDAARQVGGYHESLVTNEDAEFAHRMGHVGGVWFDPTIRSTYRPRSSLPALGRQFFRYGRGRASTIRMHPRSVRLRQLPAPLLVLLLLSPWRKQALAAYVGLLGIAAVSEGRKAGPGTPAYVAALPLMHLSWGVGFLLALVDPRDRAIGA